MSLETTKLLDEFCRLCVKDDKPLGPRAEEPLRVAQCPYCKIYAFRMFVFENWEDAEDEVERMLRHKNG